MRAPFQEGQFPAPVKYGYMSVGRVEAGADALLGKTVFCLYPAPGCVPRSRRCRSRRCRTKYRQTERFWRRIWKPPSTRCGTDGQRSATGFRFLAVIGGGVPGLLVAWLCHRVPATSVSVIDPNPARQLAAETLGLDLRVDTAGMEESDVVFHASGHPEGLRAALEIAGQESVVVELSWYGRRTVPLPLGERFHPARLTIKSSQVGTVPPDRAPRWDRSRRLAVALELLKDDALSVLVSATSDFDELPNVLERLSRESADTLCHCIRYTRP